jgi:hypothetical protein
MKGVYVQHVLKEKITSVPSHVRSLPLFLKINRKRYAKRSMSSASSSFQKCHVAHVMSALSLSFLQDQTKSLRELLDVQHVLGEQRNCVLGDVSQNCHLQQVWSEHCLRKVYMRGVILHVFKPIDLLMMGLPFAFRYRKRSGGLPMCLSFLFRFSSPTFSKHYKTNLQVHTVRRSLRLKTDLECRRMCWNRRR